MNKISIKIPLMRALRSEPFTLLWVGQTISALGDGAYNIALAWEVLLLTGSGTDMGFVLFVGSIPRLLFLLLGGVTADRFPRRLIMLWSDAGRAVTVCIIAALGWLHLLQYWHLLVLTIVFGFIDSFFMPAYRAILPQLVEKDDLPSANALNGVSKQAALLIGPMLGASLVTLLAPAGALAFDSLTFLVSVILLLVLLRSRRPLDDGNFFPVLAEEVMAPEPVELIKARIPVRKIVGRTMSEMYEGVRYVLKWRWLWISILVASFANVGIVGSLDVALPKLIHDSYKSGIWLFGELGAVNTFGSVVGTFLFGQIANLRRRGLVAYLAVSCCSTGLILFGIPLPYPMRIATANIAGILIGFGLGSYGVLWATLFQKLVPGNMLGRVSSIDELGSFVFTPIGYAVGGILTDYVGPGQVFILSGIVLFILIFLALCMRDIRQLE